MWLRKNKDVTTKERQIFQVERWHLHRYKVDDKITGLCETSEYHTFVIDSVSSMHACILYLYYFIDVSLNANNYWLSFHVI